MPTRLLPGEQVPCKQVRLALHRGAPPLFIGPWRRDGKGRRAAVFATICTVCPVSLELQALYSVAARSDPLRRGEDLLDILVRLAEMPLQIEHAFAQPPHVLHQPAHLALDEMGLLAHLHVCQEGLDALPRTQHD